MTYILIMSKRRDGRLRRYYLSSLQWIVKPIAFIRKVKAPCRVTVAIR